MEARTISPPAGRLIVNCAEAAIELKEANRKAKRRNDFIVPHSSMIVVETLIVSGTCYDMLCTSESVFWENNRIWPKSLPRRLEELQEKPVAKRQAIPLDSSSFHFAWLWRGNNLWNSASCVPNWNKIFYDFPKYVQNHRNSACIPLKS